MQKYVFYKNILLNQKYAFNEKKLNTKYKKTDINRYIIYKIIKQIIQKHDIHRYIIINTIC